MMGVPVIAANYPGIRALVEGEEIGLCVNPDEPAAIAAAVNRMAADPEGRSRMKANGLRATRERYNWDSEFRRLLERFESLLATENGG